MRHHAPVILLLAVLLACASRPATRKGDEVIVVLEETTMSRLGSVDVGMGNMGQDTFALPDGTEKQGMTASLFPGDVGFVVVGVGSVLTLDDGGRWGVVDIAKPQGDMGSVTLKLVGTGDGSEVAPAEDDAAAHLDFGYRTDCPNCGQWAGWDGNLEEQWGDKVLSMQCPNCNNRFVWYSGVLKAQLQVGPPPFVPGRKA